MCDLYVCEGLGREFLFPIPSSIDIWTRFVATFVCGLAWCLFRLGDSLGITLLR